MAPAIYFATVVVAQVALITALIVNRPVCLPCIMTRTGLSMEEVVAVVELITSALTVKELIGSCEACGEEAPTIQVESPLI